MPTLTSLTVNLKGDASSLTKATRTSMKAIQGLSRGVGSTVLKVGALAGAVAGLAGGVGLLALAKSSASSVDAIGKLSTQLGITGTDVQKLGLIAELSGINTESLVKAMQRVTRLVGDAGAGSKEAGKLIDRLGLSYDTLQKATSVERFRAVVGALTSISSATERASLGNKLFEEQWQRLNPLLEGFEGNAKRAAAVFDGMGLGIGNLAPEVERLNDNFSVVGTMFKAFADLVFAKVSPGINVMVEGLGTMAEEWIKANGGAKALADTLISKVMSAASRATEMLGGLKDAATGIAFVFNTLVSSLKALGTVGAGVGAMVSSLFSGNLSGAAAIFSDLPRDAINAFNGQSDQDDPATRELERQTQLLREIVRGGATGGLTF